MAQQEQLVREVGGRKITQTQLEARLKLHGAWEEAVGELADEALAAQAAVQKGVSVAPEELQKDFDEFRASRDLYKADDTKRWLKSAGLTLEQVEDSLAGRILANKMAAKLIDDKQIESYYKKNPTEFEYARVSQIMLAVEAAAEELALSAREEGEDFGKLARAHSLDKTTCAGGGFLGLVTREDTAGLPQSIADRIFAATPGEVIGPFPSGEAHFLVKVEEVGRRPLDDDLRVAVRGLLYQQWLAEKAGSNGSNGSKKSR